MIARLLVMFALVQTGCSGPSNGTVKTAAPPAPAAKGVAEPVAAGGEVNRRIRHTATLEVVVKDLDAAQADVERLATDGGGYVAKSEVMGAIGSRRTGTWTMKVPVAKYRPTVLALLKLGIAVRNSSDSEDLTEEFVDLDARVRNLRAEEEALNKLLKETAGKLGDVLQMREQIVKTRGDIEKSEGRLKLLTAVTSFSTINLTLREQETYTPPAVPTFVSEVTETFDRSVGSLTAVGQSAALAVVAVVPWLPLIVPGVLVGRWAWRKWAKTSPPPAAPPVEPLPPAAQVG